MGKYMSIMAGALSLGVAIAPINYDGIARNAISSFGSQTGIGQVVQNVSNSAHATELNLSQYGIPPITDKDVPVRTILQNRSTKIYGEETRLNIYIKPEGTVFVYSLENQPYSVGFDADNKLPMDKSLINRTGQGFEEMPSSEEFEVPNWLINILASR